jgi:hypothetical protein
MRGVYKKYKYYIDFFLVVIIPAILICVGLVFHEFWKDEGKALNISIESKWYELFKILKVEGMPPFYYGLIKILYIFTNNKVFILKFINFIFYCLTCLLFFKQKKIPIFLKLLFLLSYPVFFEYGVIARHYIILIPFVFILFFYENNFIKRFTLILLPLVHVFGAIISWSYIISDYRNYIFNLKKKYIFLTFFLLSNLILLYFIDPFYYRYWNQIKINDLGHAFNLATHIGYSIIYLQFPNANWYETLTPNRYYLFFTALFSFFFVFNNLLQSFFLKNFKLIFFVILSSCGLFFFFYLTGHHGYRHYFFISIIIYFFFIKNISIYNHKYKIYFYINYFSGLIILLYLMLNSFFFLKKEITNEFSSSKQLSNYLLQKKIDCKKIAIYPNYAAASWSPYIDGICKPYQISSRRFSSFDYSIESPYLNVNEIKKTNKNYDLVIIPIEGIYSLNDIFKDFKEQKIKIFNNKLFGPGEEIFVYIKKYN